MSRASCAPGGTGSSSAKARTIIKVLSSPAGVTATRSAWRGRNTTAPDDETGELRDVFGEEESGDDGSAELGGGEALGDDRDGGGGGAALGEDREGGGGRREGGGCWRSRASTSSGMR